MTNMYALTIIIILQVLAYEGIDDPKKYILDSELTLDSVKVRFKVFVIYYWFFTLVINEMESPPKLLILMFVNLNT